MLVENDELARRIADLERRLDRIEADAEDSVLSAEDAAALSETRELFRQGKTVSLEELERELGS